MPVFVYTAIDPNSNKNVEGRLEAANLREAKEILRTQGHIPTKLEEDAQAMTVDQLVAQLPVVGELFAPRAGLKDINIMTQQLCTLIDAGIPLIEALFLLEQQTVNKRLREILKKVRTDVIAGDSFSVALSRYPKEFSRLYVNMIRAGEVSGELDKICNRLSLLLEKHILLTGKIQGAMVYPAFTVLVILGVIVIIMVVVVPQFQNLFSGYGAELPLPTQCLIATSQFVQSFWWAIMGALAGLLFWFNVFRLGKGKPLVDQWLLTIPLIGDLLRKVYISRFIRTLGTVFGSGVPLTEGIVTAAGTVDNYVLRVAFDKAKESILAGGSLGKPLEQTGMFPVMVVKMIAIAEETGKLESMLDKAAGFLDMEVDAAVDTLTTMIEPIMIIVLGGIILMVALSLYMPMFEMGKVVAGN